MCHIDGELAKQFWAGHSPASYREGTEPVALTELAQSPLRVPQGSGHYDAVRTGVLIGCQRAQGDAELWDTSPALRSGGCVPKLGVCGGAACRRAPAVAGQPFQASP